MSDADETLYNWYVTEVHRRLCPKCNHQQVTELDYGHDKNGVGIIYRCNRCLYTYGVEDETNRAYMDKNQRPTLYWE